MKTIGKFTVGSLVGLAITLGAGGVATAAPTTTTTGATASTAPTTTTPATSAPKKAGVLNVTQIWTIVNPKHRIECSRASEELKKIGKADAAATKRLDRWDRLSAAARAGTAKNAKSQIKHTAGRVKYFQKLLKDGAALTKKVDAKCAKAVPAG
jgi:hypothetical protein